MTKKLEAKSTELPNVPIVVESFENSRMRVMESYEASFSCPVPTTTSQYTHKG